MTTTFDTDLAALTTEMSAARDDLASVIATLADGDLDRSPRGGWTVRRVLEHVIEAEWMYIAATAFLNEKPASERPAASIESVDDIAPKLQAGRNALLTALEGMGEDRFYTIEHIGHEEYSPFSILENVANHDREHAAQLRKILAAA